MVSKNVKRLIFVAAPGIYDELPESFNEWNKQQFGEKLSLYRKASDIIESSDLDYTIIRPGWLTDKMKMSLKLQQKTKHLEVRKFQEKVSHH